MKLYHGSSHQHLASMMKRGIAPRAVTNGKDNWKHTVTSNKDAVYLTNCYAWHFAAHASDDKVGLILEIDRANLLPWKLCPDEDFLEQSSRKLDPTEEFPNRAPTSWDMKRRTKFYRKLARYNPKLADTSLDYMGTVGYYDTIPWDAVDRYVIVDWKKLDLGLYMQAVDSMVAGLNYRILSDRHKAFTKWFFGDEVSPAAVSGQENWTGATGPLKELIDKQVAACAEAMSNRKGLTVVDLRKER